MNSQQTRQLVDRLADVDVPEGLSSAIDARLASLRDKRSATTTARRHALGIMLTGGLGALGIQLYLILTGRLEFLFISPVVQRWGDWLLDMPLPETGSYSVGMMLVIYVVSLVLVSR